MTEAQYVAAETFHDDRDDTDIEAGTQVSAGHRLVDEYPDRFVPVSSPGQFDPGEHTVAEVNEYLAGADEAEWDRVMQAEQAGKNRKTIGVSSETTDEGESS